MFEAARIASLGLAATGLLGCGGTPPEPVAPVPPPAPEPEPIVVTAEQLDGMWLAESEGSEQPAMFLELTGETPQTVRVCDGPPPRGECDCEDAPVTLDGADLTIACPEGRTIAGSFDPETEKLTIDDGGTARTLAATDGFQLEYWLEVRRMSLGHPEVDVAPLQLIFSVAREAAERVTDEPDLRLYRRSLDYTFATFSDRFRCRTARDGTWRARRGVTPDCDGHRAEAVELVEARVRRLWERTNR